MVCWSLLFVVVCCVMLVGIIRLFSLSLLVVCWLFVFLYCSLCAAVCLLFVVCCLLVLFVGCCLLFVVRCSLLVACCSLFDVVVLLMVCHVV